MLSNFVDIRETRVNQTETQNNESTERTTLGVRGFRSSFCGPKNQHIQGI